MGDPQVWVVPAEVAADLDQAADVAGEDRLCPGVEEIFRFAQAETLGHLGLGNVVAAGGAATDFAFIERDQFQAGDHFQELAGLLADLLAVAQVAGIVIGGAEGEWILRLDRA